MNHLSMVGPVPEVDSPSDAEVANLDSSVQVPQRSKKGVKVNTSLRFYHDVIGLDHLHYGLWNGEPRTLEGLKTAQERYAERVASWIPDDVHLILDVGCGTGATTSMLQERGYRVEGLAPDPYQEAIFRRNTGGAAFHLTRFQEFRPAHGFDLVLMSESAQYVWLPDLFPSVLRSAPGGWLLVSDYFRLEDDENAGKSGHLLDEFLARADEHGLEVVRREDLTDLVTPTLDLARGWLDRYVEPTFRLVLERYPSVATLGRWIVPGLTQKFEDLKVQVDSENFSRSKRYLFFLFKVPG